MSFLGDQTLAAALTHVPLAPLAGGALIGAAASLFLLAHGRVAGISGLYGALFHRGTTDRPLRLAFLGGLVLTGLALRVAWPAAFASAWTAPWPLALVAGLLVGVGTQLGSGCTSGHGVCGISRFSLRSLVATVTFIGTGVLTTFLVRHVLGGAP